MNVLIYDKSKLVQLEIAKMIRKRYNSFSLFFADRPGQVEKIEHNIELIIAHHKLYKSIDGWFPKARVIQYRKESQPTDNFRTVKFEDLEDKI